jgi:alkanesulfonate monooxygenase SsuD/methylene tetrahydromethanopterin reductase-like flavin-dependent oxidoreductase (luciferase family)
MKVGVQLPEVEREVRWPELREMARVGEAIGLDSLWVGDHLLYRRPDSVRGPWEAWSLLAALAAVTKRVELGPLVAATSFHAPAMIAKKAATIEDISGGRLILGLGAGWNEDEYRAFGFPFDRRVSRFEEAFTIIRTLLRDGVADFRGDHYHVEDCHLVPRGPRPGGPPLMVGSIGELMLAITLPHVDAWNAWHAWYGNDPDRYPELRDRVDAACRAAGRDPAEVARTVALYVQLPGGAGREQSADEHRAPPIPLDRLTDALHRLAGHAVAHVQLVVDPITVDSIAALEPSLSAFRVSG